MAATRPKTSPSRWEPPGERQLRRLLDRLCEAPRGSATAGERRAAEWLAAQLADVGAAPRLEQENAHGTYWWPLGIASALGAIGGIAALRGRRFFGVALGAIAAAAIADEFPPRGRALRSLLGKRESWNVVAELGPAEAKRAIVIVAHHDSAHSGLIFHPGIPQAIARIDPSAFERHDTSPPLMWPAVGAPLAVAAGSLAGSKVVTGLGAVVAAGYAAAMAEIGSRGVVPGANDNGTGVVLLIAIAQALAAQPTSQLRVLLVSCGSEESFSEGMKAFGERHFPQLPRESTAFLCVDTVGSPKLNVLRGEGFLHMYEYSPEMLALLDGLAAELGIELVPNLRLRNGTDGLESLAAGYPTAALCSVTELKQPANYHWPSDLPENVDYGTFRDAIRLVEALVRRLDESWLG